MSETITSDNIPEPLRYLPEEFLENNIAVLNSDPHRIVMTIEEVQTTRDTPAFRGQFVPPDRNPISYETVMNVPVDNNSFDVKRATVVIGLVSLLHKQQLSEQKASQMVMNVLSVLEPGTYMLPYNWFHIKMHSDDSFKVYGYHLVPKRPTSLN